MHLGEAVLRKSGSEETSASRGRRLVVVVVAKASKKVKVG